MMYIFCSESDMKMLPSLARSLNIIPIKDEVYNKLVKIEDTYFKEKREPFIKEKSGVQVTVKYNEYNK